MTTAEWIAERRQLEQAATEGPWESDYHEIMQHWSRPEPWEVIASSDVHCGSYCLGGSARAIRRPEDGRFIADARTSLPAALNALEAVLRIWPDTDPCPPRTCVHVDCEVINAITEALGAES